MMMDARLRHEMVNKPLKDYNILQNTYRGQLEWHHYVLRAVANFVQMKIENNEMHVFQVIVDGDYGSN